MKRCIGKIEGKKKEEIRGMRLRNVRGSKEALDASAYVIKNPEQYKGRWHEVFKNDNPVSIEIGMGKGKFITTLAKQNPNINYVGIEKFSSVLVRGLEKQKELALANLFFLREDAEGLSEFFEKEEVNRIYLNFSDPWPKDRHAKRRLTSKEYFRRYEQILEKEGEVEFKTDNRSLFEFSLEEAALAGWCVIAHTFDLHHSKMADGNIMTEYEEKFSAKGNPICKMIAKRKSDT